MVRMVLIVTTSTTHQSMPKVNWVCLKQKLKTKQPTATYILAKQTKRQSLVAWVWVSNQPLTSVSKQVITT